MIINKIHFFEIYLDLAKAILKESFIVNLKPFFSKECMAVVVIPSGDVISFLKTAGCIYDYFAYIIEPKIVW